MTQIVFDGTARLAQSYILTAQNREAALKEARRLAAAAVCQGEGEKPCFKCRACRKAAEGIHPDIISLRRPFDDKGRQKKEITVEQVRAMASDSVVLPNESRRKVYIIEDADMMNAQAQNAALKLLEEPPESAVFILVAENAELLLPTVRSRCVTLRCESEPERADAESKRLAEEFFKTAALNSASRMCAWCFANEGMDGRAASEFIASAQALAADMLCSRADALGMSQRRLVGLYELLRRCETYLTANVGVKHIFGLLAVEAAKAGD